MKNHEGLKTKENAVKFIKKANPNKEKLAVRKVDGKKVTVEKTMSTGCVPTGHD